MPERRDLLDPLRRADAELQKERLGAEAGVRLRRLVEQRPRVTGRRWGWAVAAAAAAAVLLVWILIPGERPAPGPHVVGELHVVAGRAALSTGGAGVECNSRACTLEARDVSTRLELTSGTVVGRRRGQLVLVRGRATCRVDRRPKGATPVRVYVSRGYIEVMGTVFDLRQDPGDGGEVHLRQGAIRFVADDGRAVRLAPGQRLSWPLPPGEKNAPPAPVSQPATRPARPSHHGPLSPREVETLEDQVARLRNQGRYAEAARALRRALSRIADRATRESFSYELGSILTHHLPDAAAACRHWRRHLRRFGTGRYGEEIKKERARLGCP